MLHSSKSLPNCPKISNSDASFSERTCSISPRFRHILFSNKTFDLLFFFFTTESRSSSPSSASSGNSCESDEEDVSVEIEDGRNGSSTGQMSDSKTSITARDLSPISLLSPITDEAADKANEEDKRRKGVEKSSSSDAEDASPEEDQTHRLVIKTLSSPSHADEDECRERRDSSIEKDEPISPNSADGKVDISAGSTSSTDRFASDSTASFTSPEAKIRFASDATANFISPEAKISLSRFNVGENDVGSSDEETTPSASRVSATSTPIASAVNIH